MYKRQVLYSTGEEVDCNFSMHVRPMGVSLEYDFLRLEADLVEAGILVKEDSWFGRLSCALLMEFWLKKMREDPFYFLGDDSREFFVGATGNGNRRVEIESFESV